MDENADIDAAESADASYEGCVCAACVRCRLWVREGKGHSCLSIRIRYDVFTVF